MPWLLILFWKRTPCRQKTPQFASFVHVLATSAPAGHFALTSRFSLL